MVRGNEWSPTKEVSTNDRTCQPERWRNKEEGTRRLRIIACSSLESVWSGKVSRLWLLCIVCLWAFYQDHKSTLCNSKLVVVKGVHFLARLGVIAFFCNYRDKKCTPGAIHHSLRGWES